MKSVYYIPEFISGKRLTSCLVLTTSSIASNITAGITGGIAAAAGTVVGAVVDNPGKIVAVIGAAAIPGPAAPG